MPWLPRGSRPTAETVSDSSMTVLQSLTPDLDAVTASLHSRSLVTRPTVADIAASLDYY